MVAALSLLPPCLVLLSPVLVLAQCPRGLYAVVGSLLSNYAPAQSYCSSKYPVHSTVWVTAYTTSVTIVGTSYGTTTVATTTSTVAAPAVTSPVTVTTETINRVVDTTTLEQTETTVTTEKTTVTLDTMFIKAKRAVATPTKASTTSKDARQLAFSNFAKQANAFVSTVCVKCVESQQTVTSTKTLPVFSRVTASSTASVTATNTETTTPTVLLTVTATSISPQTETRTRTTTTVSTTLLRYGGFQR